MSRELPSDRPRQPAGPTVLVAVAMIIVGIAAFRFLGASSPYVRIVIGLWIAGWLGAAVYSWVRPSADQVTEAEERQSEPIAELSWRRSIERHDAVLAAYAPYEVDPLVALEHPAMSDVTHDETATFFEALGAAQELRTESLPSPVFVEEYQRRVSALERAWEVARRHSLTAGRSYLDANDAGDLAQAVKLLRHAQSVAGTAERGVYISRAQVVLRDLVARGLVVIPVKVTGNIEAAARRSIEGKNSDIDSESPPPPA